MKKNLEIVGECFRKAVKESSSLLEATETFARNVHETGIPELQPYAVLMKKSGEARKESYLSTKLVEDMLFLAEHIVLYRSIKEKSFKPYIDFSGRKKSFQSESKKVLQHLLDLKEPTVKDRFACRLTFLNHNEIEAIQMAETTINDLISFFCGYNPEEKELFLSWIAHKSSIDKKDKNKIRSVLKLPFELVLAEIQSNGQSPQDNIYIPDKINILKEYRYGVKNYVANPKETGYQSWHFVLHLPDYSPSCPGFYVEFQLRTFAMHWRAEFDEKASHNHYAETKDSKYNLDKIFALSPEDIGIEGVRLDSNGHCLDMVGLIQPKIFISKAVQF